MLFFQEILLSEVTKYFIGFVLMCKLSWTPPISQQDNLFVLHN